MIDHGDISHITDTPVDYRILLYLYILSTHSAHASFHDPFVTVYIPIITHQITITYPRTHTPSFF